jgi:hypothetical protein
MNHEELGRKYSIAHLDPELLLSPSMTAELLGVTTSWLVKDRQGPRRIPYIFVSTKCIRYRVGDIQEFIKSRTIAGRRAAKEAEATA